MLHSKQLRYTVVMVVVALALMASSCWGTSSSTASCAYIVGVGGSYDAKVHEIVYPGETVRDTLTGETVKYVPCNSRNYIINDGSPKISGQTPVGDRFTPIIASTKSGIQIKVWASAFWMLNQSESALRKFYDVCFKYTCASDKDVGGGANFSTPGWNGMLGENFGPSMDGAARKAAFQFDDEIWKTHNPDLYQKLADEMSKVFADSVRARLGYSEDLFCSSQNSSWDDPLKPGKGKFNCSPVRITVEYVDRFQSQGGEDTQSAKDLNTQRLGNAKELYGPDAGYWLGLMDAIDRCKAAGVYCIINIGGTGGGPAVPMPGNSPIVVVTPTPVPAKK